MNISLVFLKNIFRLFLERLFKQKTQIMHFQDSQSEFL